MSGLSRVLAVLVAVFAVGGQLLAGAPEAAAQLREREFGSAAGARQYYLHLPPGDTAGKPLMVYLHGCTDPWKQLVETGFSLTRVADELGFVLAYPIQPKAANDRYCWNWFDPANQRRGQGEPAVLAGLAESLVGEFGLDRDRVYAGGYSAGGAMSTVLAATYPDLFAAIAPMAGAPYGLNPKIFGTDLSGAPIVAAMGARARPVPAFFLQDLADQTSLYPIGRTNLLQWLDAYRRTGAPSVADTPSAITVTGAPVPTTVESYRAGRCEIAQFRTPIGPDHIGGGLLMQSPTGLELQREMMKFLMAQELRGAGEFC